jgi:hypothetical protein
MIFPNPANDHINIRSSKEVELIRIFDISGNQVSEIFPGCISARISIGHFIPGIYLIQVQTSNQTITSKLSVTK